MTINDFIALPVDKYALISVAMWQQDPVAAKLAVVPRKFIVGAAEYCVLSIESTELAGLVEYVESIGSGIEFTFTTGSGLVTLLTHEQALIFFEELENGRV